MNEYQSSRNNGIGTYIRELSCCLSNTNYKIIKINFNADVDEFEIDATSNDMFLPQFHSGNFIDNPESVADILSLHITDSCDNLFVVNYSPCNSLICIMKEVFPLSKFVFVIHDLCWTARFMGDIKLLCSIDDNDMLCSRIAQEKEMMDSVDYVVCLNNDTYEVLKDVYCIVENKVFIIGNGLTPILTEKYDKNILRRELNLTETEPIMLFVGRLTHAKGLEVLIDAFKIVLEIIPQMRLALVGTHDPTFSRVSVDSKLAPRIIFTGHIDKDELNKWYAVSDIGVIPSYSEQCSFVAIEMMMHSMAIVYADSFGLRCMFDNGYNALTARRNEYFKENLASAIIELISDNQLRCKIQQNAFDNYIKKYSSEVMRQNYLKMLNVIYND